MNIAARLQELRRNAGYSQEQVAELLDISRQAISKWESAQANPDAENIIKLADLYHVSADYLLLGYEKSSAVPDKKHMSREVRITLCIIALTASTAILTGGFIFFLVKLAGGW